ncbi:hypothetical protein EVAR_9419_1 [Eumeta japonica]|uniref:Transmembrane protein INAFM2 n=1 Tax=Eumeta variegata TaxID=151549 RepID=A0A4C1UCY9_EUMVA|nr:hypothetical protein EVAR_9419_1 [Eumeta japonica]
MGPPREKVRGSADVLVDLGCGRKYVDGVVKQRPVEARALAGRAAGRRTATGSGRSRTRVANPLGPPDAAATRVVLAGRLGPRPGRGGGGGMSVCGQPEDESSTEGPAGPGPPRDLYVPKNGGSTGKAVRVLTVVAYLLSVSLAAILLSVYYVCVWSPSVLPPLANHTDEVGHPLAQRAALDHTSLTDDGKIVIPAVAAVLTPSPMRRLRGLVSDTSKFSDFAPTRQKMGERQWWCCELIYCVTRKVLNRILYKLCPSMRLGTDRPCTPDAGGNLT